MRSKFVLKLIETSLMLDEKIYCPISVSEYINIYSIHA